MLVEDGEEVVLAHEQESSRQHIKRIIGIDLQCCLIDDHLVGLPFFIALALTVLNPTYMDPLYHTHAGHMLMVGGVTMMAFGSLLLKRIVSFKG